MLLLAGCGGASRGAQNQEGVITPLTLQPPPVYALLGARAELNLTSAQVATLDSIAEAFQEENRPLAEELQRVSGADGPGVYRIRPEGEPILESIQANQKRANESVAAALTEEQRATVCRLFSQPPAGGRGGQPGRAPARMQAGSPGDTTRIERSGRPVVWSWCTAPIPAEGLSSVRVNG
jgi:hypothetical protein